MEPVNLIFCLG